MFTPMNPVLKFDANTPGRELERLEGAAQRIIDKIRGARLLFDVEELDVLHRLFSQLHVSFSKKMDETESLDRKAEGESEKD